MEEIYKSTLLLIHSITQMNGVCNQFFLSPNDKNGDKIIEIVDKCEENFLKVKEKIVRMVRGFEVEENSVPLIEPEAKSINNSQEVKAIKTEGGFLISNKEIL